MQVLYLSQSRARRRAVAQLCLCLCLTLAAAEAPLDLVQAATDSLAGESYVDGVSGAINVGDNTVEIEVRVHGVHNTSDIALYVMAPALIARVLAADADAGCLRSRFVDDVCCLRALCADLFVETHLADLCRRDASPESCENWNTTRAAAIAPSAIASDMGMADAQGLRASLLRSSSDAVSTITITVDLLSLSSYTYTDGKEQVLMAGLLFSGGASAGHRLQQAVFSVRWVELATATFQFASTHDKQVGSNSVMTCTYKSDVDDICVYCMQQGPVEGAPGSPIPAGAVFIAPVAGKPVDVVASSTEPYDPLRYIEEPLCVWTCPSAFVYDAASGRCRLDDMVVGLGGVNIDDGAAGVATVSAAEESAIAAQDAAETQLQPTFAVATSAPGLTPDHVLLLHSVVAELLGQYVCPGTSKWAVCLMFWDKASNSGVLVTANEIRRLATAGQAARRRLLSAAADAPYVLVATGNIPASFFQTFPDTPRELQNRSARESPFAAQVELLLRQLSGDAGFQLQVAETVFGAQSLQMLKSERGFADSALAAALVGSGVRGVDGAVTVNVVRREGVLHSLYFSGNVNETDRESSYLQRTAVIAMDDSQEVLRVIIWALLYAVGTLFLGVSVVLDCIVPSCRPRPHRA